MHTSNHAKARMRQRGITPEDINVILDYGDAVTRPGSAMEIFIRQDHVNALIKQYRNRLTILEKVRGKAILVSQDGTIITNYRKN